jgi:HlyD family secretion protein
MHGGGTRTVYVLNTTKEPGHPELTAVQIRTGINDGVDTEVVQGLKEGDLVATGISLPDAEPAQANPFSGRRRF